MLLTRILIMLQTIAHLLAALILSRHRLELNEAFIAGSPAEGRSR